MPVAWLTGLATEDREDVLGWLAEERFERVQLSKVTYIALRGLDPPEKEILRKDGIRAFTMHAVGHPLEQKMLE